MSLKKFLPRFYKIYSILFLSLVINFSVFATQGGGQQEPQQTAAAGSGQGANASGGGAAGGGAAGGGAANPLVQQGAEVFAANCKQCHAIHEVKVGPALKDADKRWGSPTRIKTFIKNPGKVIASGDDYAKQLFDKFKPQIMPSHEFLTEQELDGVVAYIKDESTKPPVTTTSTTTTTTGGVPTTSQSEGSPLLYGLIIVVLVLLIIVLILILIVIRKYLADREATLAPEEVEVVNQRFNLMSVIRSRYFITIVSFLFICVAARSCWVNLLGIGVEQGYMPKQPIPFSHKLHAGQYKINCNYCHTGVTKGKNANIPSLNICMNCHSQIKQGPSGGDNLAQLRANYESKTPVKWVRVHNLPDLAYFNHAQHVKVGGIECKTCHGPIDSMEVVYQYSPLTMGWCINCHRETNVNAKGNAYYDNLMKEHDKLKGKTKGEMKVSEIGGLECSRCHY